MENLIFLSLTVSNCGLTKKVKGVDSVFSLDSWKIKDLYVTVRMR